MKKSSILLALVLLVSQAYADSNKAQVYDPNGKLAKAFETMVSASQFWLKQYNKVRDRFEETYVNPPGNVDYSKLDLEEGLALAKDNDLTAVEKIEGAMSSSWAKQIDGTVLLALRFQKTKEAKIIDIVKAQAKNLSNDKVRGAVAYAAQYLGDQGVGIALEALNDDSMLVRLVAAESLRVLMTQK